MFDLVKFNQVMVIIIQMIQLVKKQIDKYAISKTPKASLKLELLASLLSDALGVTAV